MKGLNVIEPVHMDEFLTRVIRFKMEGWRLVQICASRIPDGYELSYSFSKDYDMQTLRLTVEEEQPVSSITQVYPCAFIQENEVAELFGVKIENISHDYKYRLYRIDRDTPFKEKG